MTTPTPYVTRAEIAQQLGISPRTVDALVRDGRLPKPIRLGKKIVRFPRHEIEAMLASARG